MRFYQVWLIVLAACTWPLTAQSSCIALGNNCSNTTGTCCPPGVYSDPNQKTGCRCILPTATTTSSTSAGTTTTRAGQTSTTTFAAITTTTSTTIPTTPLPDAALRFLPADLAPTSSQGAQFAGHMVDPRNGLMANQHVLSVIGWQLMAMTADMVNAADAVGCKVNDNQLKDALWKFGLNYVLNHTGGQKTSGAYQWMQPTYVRQYTLGPLLSVVPCLKATGALTPALAQIAGLEDGPHSPAPMAPNANMMGGVLTYTAGHYPPLTDAQCAALARAEDAHMLHDRDLIAHDWAKAEADNPAVIQTEEEFERTALTIDQQTLFTFIWNGTYNRNNPQDVLDGLTQRIIDHHHAATEALGCATHRPPNVTRWMEEVLWHNQLHWCRATTHNLDVPMRTVCIDQPIDNCPALTCRQQAAL